jgi:streptomycin 6-kinase
VTRLEIPDAVRSNARVHGAGAWIEALPDLVAQIERDWAIRVGGALAGGTEAFVAEATLAGGAPAVLKLMVPRAGNDARDEITVLRLANGEGCARLLRHDVARGALLVERLGAPLLALGLPLARQHEILCGLAQRLWRPAPDSGLRSGAEKARWLAGFIPRTWEAVGRACSERAVAHALACAQRRSAAHDDARAVLVHGDIHAGNALACADGFKLIDPDGLLAEPEYDLGILMREDPEQLAGDGWARAHALAERTGTRADAIWEWGAVERVSSGLLCVQIGLDEVGRGMLAAAERVAALAAR